jgi:hypothetical protein
MDTDTVVVARQQNQRHQNLQGPLLLTGQCCGHGVMMRIKYGVGGGFHLHAKELVPCERKEKKAQLYLRHMYFNIANLDPIFSESRSGTIANKNQKRITAGTHYWVSGNQSFCSVPTETIDGRVKK